MSTEEMISSAKSILPKLKNTSRGKNRKAEQLDNYFLCDVLRGESNSPCVPSGCDFRPPRPLLKTALLCCGADFQVATLHWLHQAYRRRLTDVLAGYSRALMPAREGAMTASCTG